MTADDTDLLARITAGDAEALHALYLAYRPRLRSFLWRQLDSDVGQVEDALQEVFLAIWRAAPNFRGEAQVATWIFRIAHHVASHTRRDRHRQPEGHALLLPEDDDPIWVQVSHEDAILDRLALEDALSHLTPHHRAALDLVFAQGFTLAEAAQILDVPLGTVKSRLSYARRALLAAIQRLEETRHDA